MSVSTDPTLKNSFREHGSPAPPAIETQELHHIKRVGRPLRHVKYIPTKQLVFYSKHKEPQFTYDIKYKLSSFPKNKIVIQVDHASLSPVDLKIINSYTSNLNTERGIGREFSGIVTHVGSALQGEKKSEKRIALDSTSYDTYEHREDSFDQREDSFDMKTKAAAQSQTTGEESLANQLDEVNLDRQVTDSSSSGSSESLETGTSQTKKASPHPAQEEEYVEPPEDLTKWRVGERVCGLYFHPNSYGTVASSIMVNPATDIVIRKPRELNNVEASSWFITFGAAHQILQKAKPQRDWSVVVNGGSSSVGLMLIQLLKKVYEVETVIAICSGSAIDMVKKAGADLCVNYKIKKDIPGVLQTLASTGVYKDYDDQGNSKDFLGIPAKKFDLIVDCVGSYKLVAHAADYLSPSGQYVTTVGDKHFDYHKDVYNSWSTLSMGARSLFGSSWGVNYSKFYFDTRVPKPNDPNADWVAVGCDLLKNKQIVNHIDSVYNWKDYKRAKEKLQSGHAHGKVVLQVDKF